MRKLIFFKCQCSWVGVGLVYWDCVWYIPNTFHHRRFKAIQKCCFLIILLNIYFVSHQSVQWACVFLAWLKFCKYWCIFNFLQALNVLRTLEILNLLVDCPFCVVIAPSSNQSTPNLSLCSYWKKFGEKLATHKCQPYW